MLKFVFQTVQKHAQTYEDLLCTESRTINRVTLPDTKRKLLTLFLLYVFLAEDLQDLISDASAFCCSFQLASN